MKQIKLWLMSTAIACLPLPALAEAPKAPDMITNFLDYLAKRLVFEQNGGDAYPYVIADKRDGEKIKLWIGSKGGPTYAVSVFISPFEAARDPNNPLYWSFVDRKHGYAILYEGSVLMGEELPPGKYYVEMSAKNGTVVEVLTIGAGTRSVELVRGGEKLAVPE